MTKPLDDMFEKEAIARRTDELAAVIKPPVEVGGDILDLSVMNKKAEEGASFSGQAIKSLVPAVGAMTGLSSLIAPKPKPKSEIESEVIDDLLDPSHEAEMQRIRMQAMLTEFLADDPVISTYDTDQVIEAFNQIAQMTPRASIQPAIMRGQLRKMLQQQDAMEPFEAGQLLDVEQGLKNVAEPAPLPLADLPEVADDRKRDDE